MFIEETSASTRIARLRGQSERGKRRIAKVPHGHWKTTTFVAVFRRDSLTAPVVVDGAMTGKIFLSYVRKELVPTLHPGDIIVMDNLAAQKVAGVRESIETAGATVAYLPPYSPDGQRAMIPSRKFVPVFTPQECTCYFKHCGY